MTIDEALKHCEEIAKDKANLASILWDSKEKARCEECAAEHRQLAEWLKEYKQLKEKKKRLGHWIEKEDCYGDTYYECSECGELWTTIEGTPWNNGMKYCPECGIRMEGGYDGQIRSS